VDPDADMLEALKQQVQAEMAEKMKSATTKEDLERIQRSAEEQSTKVGGLLRSSTPSLTFEVCECMCVFKCGLVPGL
jgi:mevalonate pyrophosphate decarboxylase